MNDAHRSLMKTYPRRLDMPLGIIGAGTLLGVGLALPVMSIKRLVFWKDDYSIVAGVASLWEENYFVLAAIIAAFSIAFPAIKLGAMLAIWFTPLHDSARRRWLRWLAALGRWSMLDVFVVALTIVLTRANAFADVAPRAGLYVFAGAVALTTVVSLEMERLARKAGGAPP
jgi:paraquat-inducible protein A